MPNLTQLITRQSGLLAWYPLDNDAPAASVISDESGNNKDMGPVGLDSDIATITADVLNGRQGVVHNADQYPMAWTSAVSIRDVFIVAKVDDTPDFDDPYRGLLSGVDDTSVALLVGKGSTTRWLSNAEGSAVMGYLLDDVLQADTARSAPFDAFHRIRISTSGSAVAMDGIQVGRDREHTDRLFKGKWTDLMLFSTQRTSDEANAIALYQDLKFNLWRTNGTTINFPTPGMTGINYRRFYAAPEKWEDTVVTHEYEDGGISVNEITDTAVKEWEVEFDCVAQTHALAKTQYEIFDEFWNAVRTSRSFNFTDKDGTTHTGVRVKKYSRDHRAHKSWQNEAAFTLVKYP